MTTPNEPLTPMDQLRELKLTPALPRDQLRQVIAAAVQEIQDRLTVLEEQAAARRTRRRRERP